MYKNLTNLRSLVGTKLLREDSIRGNFELWKLEIPYSLMILEKK